MRRYTDRLRLYQSQVDADASRTNGDALLRTESGQTGSVATPRMCRAQEDAEDHPASVSLADEHAQVEEAAALARKADKMLVQMARALESLMLHQAAMRPKEPAAATEVCMQGVESGGVSDMCMCGCVHS